MNDKIKKWIEASKILEIDSSKKIKCPECSIGNLFVKDEFIVEWNKIDRYLICDHCGNWNGITMSVPSNYDASTGQ